MKPGVARTWRGAFLTMSLVLAAGVIALVPNARSQNAPSPTPEQAIKYRQGVYKVILWNFGPLGAVAQGKAQYDPDEFAKRAARVATMAPMLIEGYPPGSDTGAVTRAKPEIWSNMEEFRELMNTMVGRAADLSAAAQTRDEAKAKAAVGDLGKACKACHDKYRTD
jgi:cytochrome c556